MHDKQNEAVGQEYLRLSRENDLTDVRELVQPIDMESSGQKLEDSSPLS